MGINLNDISRAFCLPISKKSEENFTGKVAITMEVNMCNGGITDAFVVKETTRNRVKGK